MLGERSRIAREIHDTLAQGYVGVSVQLEVLAELLRQRKVEDAGKATGPDARICAPWAGRRAAIDLGFAHAGCGRDHAARETAAHGGSGGRQRSDVPVQLFGAYRPLPAETEREVMRVAQEAIHNVKKHAGASQLSVELEYGPETIALEVRDDGRGGAQERTAESVPGHVGPGHFGLTGMRERAAAIGGTLEVSSAPGDGNDDTVVRTGAGRSARTDGGTRVTTESIRVLVVEDHNVVRQGLVALLNVVEGLKVVGEAADGVEAITQFRKHQPDITLIDLRLPRMSGVDAIERIRMETPHARFIVLTTYDGDEDIYRALKAGARAYLLKGMTSEDLITTIRAVHAGKSHIPPAIAERLAERMGAQDLTPREFDVLEQIVHGKSNREIAAELEVSEATVKTHINSLLGKLGVTDRTQAATAAIQRGIVPLESLRKPKP